MTARQVIDGAVREAELQAQVVELARLTGWLTYHPYDSRRSEAGWRDLALVKGGRLVFLELKTETGRATAEQHRWLLELAAVPGVTALVARPGDWARIEALLTGGRP